MTVPVQDPEVAHVGNGVTTVFAYPFLLFSTAHIVVRLNGVLAVLNVDYTVAGLGVEAGGNVTFTVAPANGVSVTMKRSVPLARATDYQYSGDFQSPTVNRDFDLTWMALQDTRKDSDRALRLPIGDPATTELPDAATRALKGLAFDADGDPTVTAASDATTLAVVLASPSDTDTGGGIVGYDGALNYAAGTVGKGVKDAAAAATAATSNINTYKTDVASAIDAAKGAALMGYLPSFTGAVGRTLTDRLQDTVSAKDFGLKTTNTGAQNVAAWNLAIAFAIAQGGLTLHIPRGTYDFNGTISFTNAHNLRVTGDGPDATILRITHASADFLSAAGSNLYTCFDNFTLTSSVVRTGGAMFKGGFWRRALMHRVKITEHFNGIDLPGFEQATLSEVYIVKPSGAGVSIICGIQAATNQGANLNILNCFGRGNDELINNTPIGLVAMILYDIEAIFCVNSDFANYASQIMVVNPQTRVANCHFVQTFFDGTLNSDNVLMQGAGIKQQFQFTGCWFNGAGRFGAGAVDAYGVNAGGTGEYFDFNFTGCRFLSHSGAQFVSTSVWLDFNFVGCVFTNPGLNAGSVQRHSILLNPTGVVVKWPVISGCKFQGTPAASFNVVCTGNASTGTVVNGCNLDRGLSKVSTAYWGSVQGNFDAVALSTTVPAAGTITVPATMDYVVLSGASNIDRINPTWAGHKMAIRFTAAMTVNDDTNNLRLVGNYVTTTGSILTLVCEANGEWREVARASS